MLPRTRIFGIRWNRIVFIAGLVAVLFSRNAAGVVLIDDSFTGANNTALLARLSSPTDIPGNPYAGNGNLSAIGGPTGGTPYEADIQSNKARLGADAGVAINLNLAIAARFQLSLDFNVSGQSETQADNIHRGAGLGFFSSVAVGSGGAFHCFNNFTGLTVDSTGSIRLIVGGIGTGVFTTVAGFNPLIDHTLTYVVDTAVGMGTIMSLTLDGTSYSLSAPVNSFTIARATYGGFYNSSGPAGELADFDNFSIATVPESSTLFAPAGVAMLVCVVDFLVRRKKSH